MVQQTDILVTGNLTVAAPDHNSAYSRMTGGELMTLSLKASDLAPEARAALRAEVSRRGLGMTDVEQFLRECEEHRVQRRFRVFRLNGIGTRPYGERDFMADGSYLTTRWVTLLWLPVIPLDTIRVRRRERRLWSTTYDVLSVAKPNLKQVSSVYGFVTGFFGLAVLIRNWPVWANCVVGAGWILLPWAMRWRALRRPDLRNPDDGARKL